jgi:hypothetical protein
MIMDALVGHGAHRHAIGMFVVTEADAAAIRAVFNQEGELSVAIDLIYRTIRHSLIGANFVYLMR